MNKRILRRTTNVEQNIEGWLNKLDHFNRFALSMKLDFDYVVMNGDEIVMEATGQLESDRVIVSLAKDDCGWHLHLKDPDYSDRSGKEEPFQIPFNVMPGGSKFIKNIGTFSLFRTGENEYDLPRFQNRPLSEWC